MNIPTDPHECARWWKNHLDAIKDQVSADDLDLARAMTEVSNIGLEQGQVRAGNIGRWDIYSTLLPMPMADAKEAMLLAGISDGEMAEEIRRLKINNAGFDPDDPKDVAEFEELEGMTPEQLDARIASFEARQETGLKARLATATG